MQKVPYHEITVSYVEIHNLSKKDLLNLVLKKIGFEVNVEYINGDEDDLYKFYGEKVYGIGFCYNDYEYLFILRPKIIVVKILYR